MAYRPPAAIDGRDWFWCCLQVLQSVQQYSSLVVPLSTEATVFLESKSSSTRLQRYAAHQAAGESLSLPKFYSQPHLIGSSVQGNRNLTFNQWLSPATGSCMACRVRESSAVVTRGKPCNHARYNGPTYTGDKHSDDIGIGGRTRPLAWTPDAGTSPRY